MGTNYIYSVSKVKVLEQSLVGLSDLERLLTAEDDNDFLLALKETGLDLDYSKIEKRSDVLPELEKLIISAKDLLQKISPEKEALSILWLAYDIHNLRLAARAVHNNLDWKDIKTLVSEAGTYDPRYIWQKVQTKQLNDLFTGSQMVFGRLENVKSDKLDELFDDLYFTVGQSLVSKTKDKFLQSYWLSLVNLHNLGGWLRQLKNPSINFHPKLTSENNILAVDKLETEEEVLFQFAKFGGENFWREAIDYYQTTGHTTKLDVKTRERRLFLAKQSAVDMFSSASLVLYYLKCQQSVDNLRTIVVGKNSGMELSDIKSNLQTLYVNK